MDEIGVLEFVEQPVVVARVETVVDLEAVRLIWCLCQDWSGPGLSVFVARKEQLDILESELSLSSDAVGIGGFVEME